MKLYFSESGFDSDVLLEELTDVDDIVNPSEPHTIEGLGRHGVVLCDEHTLCPCGDDKPFDSLGNTRPCQTVKPKVTWSSIARIQYEGHPPETRFWSVIQSRILSL